MIGYARKRKQQEKEEVEGRLERLQTKLFYPSYLGTILHADLISRMHCVKLYIAHA